MGLLDDLKQQAESRKVEVESTQAERYRNMQAVHGALRGAFQYLTELANSLNVLKPEIVRSFFIDGGTRFENLSQCDYRVRERRRTIDHQDYYEEVSLLFSWTGGQALVAEKDTPALIQRLRDNLAGYNLRYVCNEIKNERGMVQRAVFKVQPEIIAVAAFAGDWNTGKIRLALKNIELLGSVEYQYDAAELDGTLYEELAKLVLAKPNNVRNLGKFQEMLRSAPRPRVVANDAPPPVVESPDASASGGKSGIIDGLKAILKR